jgi:hypothetical protein
MPHTADQSARTTTCFSPAAAPCPDSAARPVRRGNVVRLSDLPRVTQGRIASRLASTASSGRRLPRQR